MRENTSKKNDRYNGLDSSNWKVVSFQGVTLSSSETDEKGRVSVRILKGFNGFKAANAFAVKVGGVAVRE